MEKRRKLVSKKKENRLIISKPITRSSSKSGKVLEQIPADLINEIISKLPLKSIARLRCVSKSWNSILRSPDFTNLFLKVSSSRPRLLFITLKEGKWLFFSTPQSLKITSPLTTEYHMSFPLLPCTSNLLAPVNGLLCTGETRFKRGCNDSKVMVYNPSTGQSIPLPILKGRRDYATTYLGYDPINQQYKVLCLSMRRRLVIKHEVLTLGIKKPAWRMIECSLPRHFPCSPICINGILYYLGSYGPHGDETIVVCFDVRSEKFNFIEVNYKVKANSSTLINYKGKLGILPQVYLLNRETKTIELLVLNDVEKKKWSLHIYVLPVLWKNLVGHMRVCIKGMTANGELVFSSFDKYGLVFPYILFYNLENDTIVKVRIQGMESIKSHYIATRLHHVENVKLL